MNENQKLLTTLYQQVRGVQGTADFHMSMAVAYQRLMDELADKSQEQPKESE